VCSSDLSYAYNPCIDSSEIYKQKLLKNLSKQIVYYLDDRKKNIFTIMNGTMGYGGCEIKRTHNGMKVSRTTHWMSRGAGKSVKETGQVYRNGERNTEMGKI